MNPDRLATESDSRVTPYLSARGYQLVARGPAGVTWRREMPGGLIAALIVLSLIALGALSDLPSGLPYAFVAVVVAGAIAWTRWPDTVTATFTMGGAGGTTITLNRGRQPKVSALLAPIGRGG